MMIFFVCIDECSNIAHWQVLKRLIEHRRDELRKTYSGLTCFDHGVKQIPIESIPGVTESGWQPDQST